MTVMRSEKVTKNVIDYLDARAADRPNQAAVRDGEDELSFAQLRSQAYAVARLLLDKGCDHEPVGVYAGRTVDVIAAMLGVAAAGCAYVPLNPTVPADKNHKILSDCAARYVIGMDGTEYDAADLGCEYIRYSHKTLPGCETRPAVTIDGRDTLYLIYTSGSTGAPKGIRKSHGAQVDFIEAYVREFGFTADEIIGNQSPFSADASAKDLYLMLAAGATMEIIPTKLFSFPVQLVEYLNEKKITFISWVPSALAIVARLRTFRDVVPQYLRRVYFVGEVFPAKDLAGWREAVPEADYVNLYGSSEIAGIACYYRIPRGETAPDPLPIGKPLSNCRVYLGHDGVIDPGAEQGEIMIVSEALADEYLGNAEKTAEVFRMAEMDGETRRVLCTGDLARYDEDGKLVYLSRDDGMIKYKGYRIELGEIEAAVSALDFVVRCCCLYDAVRERITVFMSSTNPELKLRDLNAALGDTLPDYMLPKRLVLMDELPLNPNGKIDRALLKSKL